VLLKNVVVLLKMLKLVNDDWKLKAHTNKGIEGYGNYVSSE